MLNSFKLEISTLSCSVLMLSAKKKKMLRKSCRLLAVCILFAIVGIAAVTATKECIRVLDDNSFDTNIQTNIDSGITTLAMFYAPWCGHCKKLKPEIEKACEDLKNENARNIAIAKVDCTADDAKKICDFYGIGGYPTLKIFKKSLKKPDDYNGERSTDGIKKRMKKMASESVQNAKTIEEMEKIRETMPESLVLGVFESESSSSALYKEFVNVADAQRDHYTFVKTNKDVAAAFDINVDEDSVVVMYPKKMHSKFEPDFLLYDSQSHKDLTKFIKQHIHGLCGHRTKDNANDFGYPHIVAYYDVDYVKNPKGTNYWRNRIFKAVKDYIQNKNAKYSYKIGISSIDDFGHELNEFNLNAPETPKAPIVVVRTKIGSTFLLKEFSIAALQSFLNDIDNDKIEPYLKSEPIPDQKGPLLVAVAKNFDEIVFKSGKDSLIKFYAPWCGHCKKLAPVFDELAEKLKDEDVNIVKFDATANFVDPRFEVRGYPTLIWVSKSGEIKSYEGNRELNDFVKFIAKEATDELKYYDRNGSVKKTEL